MSDFVVVNLAQLSAEELARRAQAGSSDAFDALMGRYARPLERYLHRRCGNPEDAEDIRQETLLRVWKKIQKYDPSRPFGPWLFAVARNLAASKFNNRRADDGALGADPVSEVTGPAALLIEQEQNENLWSTVKQLLGDRQYAALWLRYRREMSVKQVAWTMGLTQTHVKVTLFRARRKLLRSAAIEQWK